MTPIAFHLSVMIYCAVTGASTTSGLRTLARNAAKRGVAHSPHRFNLAEDVVYDAQLSVEELQAAEKHLGVKPYIAPLIAESERVALAGRLGLKLIAESDHDHLQPEDWQQG